MLRDYNRIIDALAIRFIKTNSIEVVQPITVKEVYDIENKVILVNQGTLSFTYEGKTEHLNAGDILFLPEGKPCTITYGNQPTSEVKYDEFLKDRAQYLQSVDQPRSGTDADSFSYVTFEAKVFDAVNFFASLDVPPFIVRNSKVIFNILSTIIEESTYVKEGAKRVVALCMSYFVIEFIRYILEKELFVEQLTKNSNYFKDARLVNILTYIKENLGGNLSNKVLANQAQVSEDYVGQYFKMLTNINPQDYIEYQRMEKAVKLLRTTKKSIHDIGAEVGFKDTAYFCRRFKMMFGIPAGKMRRRELLTEL